MKKFGAIVIIILLVASGYYLYHNHTKKNATTPTATTNSTPAATAVNNAVVKTKSGSSLGDYLTDANGNALYTYGKDSSGVSNCSGSCLAAWPAYQDKGAATGLPTNISTLTRSDNGQTQYTYKGMPLYTFAADSSGQATGNGVGGFSIAKP